MATSTAIGTSFMQRRSFIAGWSLVASIPFPAQPKERDMTMEIYRRGALPTHRPPEPTFTGDVQIGGYFQRQAPSRLAGAVVTFGPGARTPWKANPLGQTLIVTSGVGWAQCRGQDVVEIRAGDLLWCPPGQLHWEGATPDQPMTYVAIHEGTVGFTQKVTDEEYLQGLAIAASRR